MNYSSGVLLGLRMAISAFMLALSASVVAEDIDIFVGGTPLPAPNVLIVLDNSSNWATASQNWPTDTAPPVPCGSACDKQGYYELKALRTVIQSLMTSSDAVPAKVNLGLMMFNNSNASRDGGYVRSEILPLNYSNGTALLNTINTIISNFNTETASSSVQYFAALYDAFKYFGGYSNPTYAKLNQQPPGAAGSSYGGVPVFGPAFWGSNNADGSKPDMRAYSGTNYVPPKLDECANANYIILIGNGLPGKDNTTPNMATVFAQLLNPQNPPASISEFNVPTYSCAGTWTDVAGASCSSTCTPNASTQSTLYQCAKSNCSGSKQINQQCTSLAVSLAAPSSNAQYRYADEMADFLYHTDVAATSGQQNVITFALDVFHDKQDLDQTALMRSVGSHGTNTSAGGYYQATSASAIVAALDQIFTSILATNSVFASASLPVTATNRTQDENQVYIGMFRPDPYARPRWFGNLKRYQLINSGGVITLGGSDGLPAIKPEDKTGFITECAVSFWTSAPASGDTTSQYYWRNDNVLVSPDPASACLGLPANQIYSDAPDGPHVEKGAIAEVLRKGNNPPATNVTPTWGVSRTLYTTSAPGSATLSLLNQASNQWLSGYNVDSEAAQLSTDKTRPSIHGDVVHSRPLPLNYSGRVVVYYGANDGNFRAVEASSGKELWSLIPYEFTQSTFVSRLRQNSPLIAYPLPWEAGVTPTPLPKAYGWDGSIGVFQGAGTGASAWIYPTMRRGGRRVFGLDVTNPDSPSILWVQGCDKAADTNCSSGFTDIGLTWSTPNAAPANGYSAAPVVFFGGGYDTCEDLDQQYPACGSAKGRKIYALDASTGVQIAAPGVQSFVTDRSVAADIALIDTNGDGTADYAYAVDTGGNIYRIDMATFSSGAYSPLPPSAWRIRKVASAGGGRKFLYAPALLGLSKQGKVVLALGSGDREHPLASNYPTTTAGMTNTFYVYVDDLSSTSGVVDLNATPALADNCTTAGTALTLTGWHMDLQHGEQTVTSALIAGGNVYFSTNLPMAPASNACSALGEARGYVMNLLNGSSAVLGSGGQCSTYSTFDGGGLPPSPVMGTVMVGGKLTTVIIGGGMQSVPIAPSPVKPAINVQRKRVYQNIHGTD